MTDEQIVEQFKTPENKEQAFRVLVERYQEKLYFHIRRFVFNHQDADDVLQNTFIKVWKSLDNFKSNSKLYTWLYRIATNESITHINKHKKRAETGLETEEGNPLEVLKADEYFDGNEIQAKLQLALNTLPDKQRSVFQLRYFEELKYNEIAEVLETSVGALKASYHHAVKKIENYFASN